jgi:quercetin dioxygenase-like cupin family protein
MLVTLAELRVLRRGALTLRVARFGDVALVLAETGPDGTSGTTLEDPCDASHWAIVLGGSLELERAEAAYRLPPGSAFHVPAGGPPHVLRATDQLRLAGMVPIRVRPAAGAPAAERATPEGFGAIVDGEVRREGTAPEAVVVVPGAGASPIDDGRIEADIVRMGDWVFTRAAFGRTSGYATSWCDAPHYGLVLSGSIAIEWEHDVEVAAAGDVYHCPAGPPGHRLEAADGAVVVDFTPATAFTESRLAGWRRTQAGSGIARVPE